MPALDAQNFAACLIWPQQALKICRKFEIYSLSAAGGEKFRQQVVYYLSASGPQAAKMFKPNVSVLCASQAPTDLMVIQN